ncbi:uncharacterized protein LOC124737588 [Schistocerca piceifrons]|uniref:uncharacterized protein LOC124737588 n=1 Tax=Schistocerca piceifrons TaxID=274613 RepID=UPI001F5F216A|nr:uncharacterized protein LOC124737588 [Schistocerca piceifrons]
MFSVLGVNVFATECSAQQLCCRLNVYIISSRGGCPPPLLRAILKFITERPNQLLSIDLAGPLPTGRGGAKYLVAILDNFSKHIRLYAVKSSCANPIIRRIENDYFPRFGVPESILSDNASNFTSRPWHAFLEDMS